MKLSLRTGVSFGMTSGIITTLGLIVGLNAASHSLSTIIGGILTIAIADSFSDALGIHVSQESQNKFSSISIWEATFSTLLTKFVVASSFIASFLVLDLKYAVYASIVWGMCLLSVISYIIGKNEHEKPGKVVIEHVSIASLVIIITNFASSAIAEFFKS